MAVNEIQIGGTHYKSQKIQHWDYVIANNLPYLEALAFKYIDRHRRKGGKEDLLKAKHTIDKMLETYYPEVPQPEEHRDEYVCGPSRGYIHQD